MDLLNAIAQDQNIQFTFVHHDWDGLFDTLHTQKADVVVGALAYNDERAQKYALSAPYLHASNVLVYQNAALNIQNYTDLKPLRVATQKDTLHHKGLSALKGSEAGIVATATAQDALQAVIDDKADVAIGNPFVLGYYVTLHQTQNPNTSWYKQNYETDGKPRQLIFVLPKTRTDLQQTINQGLYNIQQNGTYQKINQKWFGTENP